MFYPPEFKEELRERINILDVIQATGGEIYESGSSYVMKCPFHNEENPSMSIHPQKNYFQCFSCGAGTRFHDKVPSSDIFSYVSGLFNYSMYETVKYLSETFGIYPPNKEETSEQSFKRQAKEWWNSIVETSNERFIQNLKGDDKVYLYLKARGIDDLEQEKWEIGLGDAQQVEFAHSKNKITFPIRDYDGNIVSFVARVPLSKEELFLLNEKEKEQSKRVTPKYEHRWKLKPTDVNQQYYDNHPHKTFERNNYLYGIFEAKDSIRRFRKVIVTEGFTDVIALHRHNITHSVSTMGLRLSDAQVELIKKAGARSVTLMRDGDTSGIEAMERDAKLLKAHGLEVDVCPMPPGEDPDSLSKRFFINRDDYARWIRNATRTVPSWKVESIYKSKMEDILSYNSKIHIIRNEQLDSVVSILKEEDDLIERDLLIHQYSHLFNVSSGSLLGKINELTN